MYISLSLAKSHLKVDQDAEDTLIDIYIRASFEWIENYINQPMPGYYDSPTYVPDAIISAGLLIIGDLYENRQAQNDNPVKENPAVVSLLYPYRVDIGL